MTLVGRLMLKWTFTYASIFRVIAAGQIASGVAVYFCTFIPWPSVRVGAGLAMNLLVPPLAWAHMRIDSEPFGWKRSLLSAATLTPLGVGFGYWYFSRG